jgi:hypothetical protein
LSTTLTIADAGVTNPPDAFVLGPFKCVVKDVTFPTDVGSLGGVALVPSDVGLQEIDVVLQCGTTTTGAGVADVSYDFTNSKLRCFLPKTTIVGAIADAAATRVQFTGSQLGFSGASGALTKEALTEVPANFDASGVTVRLLILGR